MSVLNEVLREKQVECPIECNPEFLLDTRQLAEINRPPDPPGSEAGKVNTKNACHSGALTDGSE